jgi:HEAT repeat protein
MQILLKELHAVEEPERLDPKLEALVSQLKEKNPERQVRAAEELRKMGRQAGPTAEAALCSAAMSDDQGVRNAALGALEQVRPDLYPHIVSILVNDTRGAGPACAAIGRMKERGRPATEVLLWLAQNSLAGWVQGNRAGRRMDRRGDLQSSAIALGEVSAGDPRVVPLLSQLALSTDDAIAFVRGSAIVALGQIAEAHTSLRGQILEVMVKIADSDMGRLNALEDKIAAIGAIGGMESDAKGAVPLLKKLKLHQQERVRSAAAEALDEIERWSHQP